VSSYAIKRLTALAATGIVGAMLVYAPVSQAFNFGDMMNPGKWMGGKGDRYDDWDEGGPYGGGPWGGPYGGGPYGGGPYGGGPWGPGGGYGAPYGGPGYGAPGLYGAPGYRPTPVVPAAPTAPRSSSSSSSSENVKSAEIEALKRRIEELETKQQAPAYTAPPPSSWGSSNPSSSGSDWGSAPAFRPLNKY
jgi:hypothetical protein